MNWMDSCIGCDNMYVIRGNSSPTNSERHVIIILGDIYSERIHQSQGEWHRKL